MSRKRKYQDITALAYDKKGRLLAVGRNSYTRTHPLQAKYSARAGKPLAIYLHAELNALIKAGRKIHRLVVMRYNKDGSPALAKPCKACQLAIKDFGVRYVEHT